MGISNSYWKKMWLTGVNWIKHEAPYALHYTVNHTIIAYCIFGLTALFTQSLYWAATFGGGFYVFKELVDYYYLGKTHRGRYDWEGKLSPVAFIGFLVWVIVTVGALL